MTRRKKSDSASLADIVNPESGDGEIPEEGLSSNLDGPDPEPEEETPEPEEETPAAEAEPKKEEDKPRVLLRVFLTVAGAKPDQMAGFKYHAIKNKLGPMSIEAWKQALSDFRERPIR